MTHKTVNYWLAILFFLFCLVPPSISANEGDIVTSVSLCNDSVLVEMKDFGMVAIRKADVGEDIFQQLRSMALDFFNTGEKTGYFDPGYPTDVCGFKDVMTITILRKSK